MRKKKRRKRKEMTPSLGSCEPLVIVFARPFSVGSPRRWSKDGGLSQLSAGATIPRSHRLRAHLRDALIRFLVAPDANSAIVINSIHPLKAAARFPPSTLVSSSLFVQLWLLFRFTAFSSQPIKYSQNEWRTWIFHKICHYAGQVGEK